MTPDQGEIMANELDLHGKSAVVTGASSGIGRAIAEALGAAGAYVVLSGRDEPAMLASASRIVERGGRAEILVGDVREEKYIVSLTTAAVAATNSLDVFVNNAGVSFLSPVMTTEFESWRLMLDTNVLALLAGSQAAVRAMRATASHGHIVNISSVAARNPSSGVYGATKHAVNVISDSLRQELLDDPIKITTVMPGLVATNIGRNVDIAILEGIVAMSGIDYTVKAGERLPDDVLQNAQAVLSDIMIRPEDIADAVIFAISQPESVQLSEILVRPNKDFDL
jgi:NADP-dependent 3-hydroxy acid dehydrogenase YdfG